MKLTEDLLLDALFKNPDMQLMPSKILNENGYSVDHVHLRRVVIGLIAEGFIFEGEQWGREVSIGITPKGIAVLNQYGSYGNYISHAENEKSQKSQEMIVDRRWSKLNIIVTLILGLATVVLGIINYFQVEQSQRKDVEIEDLKVSLKKERQAFDSLNQILTDSLKNNN